MGGEGSRASLGSRGFLLEVPILVKSFNQLVHVPTLENNPHILLLVTHFEVRRPYG